MPLISAPACIALSDFYGFTEDFPRKNVFARSSEGKQRFLYIVTDVARRVLDYNDGRGVKVRSAGLLQPPQR